MELNIDSTEKQILISALRLLEGYSVDSVESGKIYSLRQRIEQLKPKDRRISVMDDEGNFYVDGELMTPSELGFQIE